MRFNLGVDDPKPGDRVTRSGFLVFPKIIQNEIRWLERALWIEEYTHKLDITTGNEDWEWVPIKWEPEWKNRLL